MSREGSDVFGQIRQGAAAVAAAARYVHLQEEHLPAYASSLSASGLPEPTYDTAHHFRGSDGDTAAFLLTLDSVNFGSGYFRHLHKRPGMSGYFTIATSLKAHWEQAGPLSGAALRGIDAAACAAIFGQNDAAEPAQELMVLFAQALRDLGMWLGRHYDDDPLAPLLAANGSAAQLISAAAQMPFYRDIASFHGRDVPLFKRAQLLAADCALAFGHTGPGAFHDLEGLTIFADNLVPHVLRLDGLLKYDAELLARIERGELLESGSPEEVEIRAVALHAVERLVAELGKTGVATTAQRLDYLLWHRGQEPAYKAVPRHRARSIYY